MLLGHSQKTQLKRGVSQNLANVRSFKITEVHREDFIKSDLKLSKLIQLIHLTEPELGTTLIIKCSQDIDDRLAEALYFR